MSDLFVGLMSGTSLDGVDAVLVDFSASPGRVIATLHQPYPRTLGDNLLALCGPLSSDVALYGRLSTELGVVFAHTVQALFCQSGVAAASVSAIGSHGQTVYHQPQGALPVTLQIGDPNIIAEITGLTTVADFRRRDMAAGGQGAPLVPAYHHYAFHSSAETRAIVNIGGIANITLLPADKKAALVGFDCGPGNMLMDGWIRTCRGQHYDEGGQWAHTGTVNATLLQALLQDEFFQRAPPKSTGRETFNLAWLEKQVSSEMRPEDVQATLVELTAQSIADALRNYPVEAVYLCGGGAHNTYLVDRLRAHLAGSVDTTEALGIHPDWVEATAFAWLAAQRLQGRPGNVPSVTGASGERVLGAVF